MTHTEKLQQIFNAALKDSSDFNKPFTRAFPTSLAAKPVAASQPTVEPAPSPEPVVEVPVALATPAASAAPATSAGLSESESTELGKLLDAQEQRKTRKRRRDALMTLGVLTILTGNAFCWFVNSPQRVVAFKEAIHDIRSVGDVKSMVAKYQVALDKIGARSKQIDQATASMGVSSNQDGVKDPNMNAEMLTTMGGEGKTTGQRNQMVQKAFGAKKENQPATTEQATVALTRDGSYR